MPHTATKLALSTCIVLVPVACAWFGPGKPPGSPEFRQACLDATTDITALNLAAHPDDEAARTLVYLRRKHGFRTVTVYSTCGGGGQNAIGTAIGKDLARIRTRETLKAAAITGTQVRWLGFADFGFSKRAAESFNVWDRQRYLAELRRHLLAVKPDLVFTNHAPDRGHGHHRASALGMREVVQQLRNERLPAPRFHFERSGVRFERRDDPELPETVALAFDTSEVDPATGESYARQAYEGWLQHRTQGVYAFWSAERIRPDHWQRVDGRREDVDLLTLPTLFDTPEFGRLAEGLGVDADALRDELQQFADPDPVAEHVARARRLLPELLRLSDQAAALSELGPVVRHRLRLRIEALQRVILLGSEVRLTAELQPQRLAPGSVGALHVSLQAKPEAKAKVRVAGARDAVWHNQQFSVPFTVPESARPKQLWPAEHQPTLEVEVNGLRMTVRPTVRYTVVPRSRVQWNRPVVLMDAAGEQAQRQLWVQVEWNGAAEAEHSLSLEPALGAAGELSFKPDAQGILMGSADVSLTVPRSGTERRVAVQAVHRVTGSDLQSRGDLTLALVQMCRPDPLRVGLIKGVDKTLQQVFHDLQVPYADLDDKTLAKAELSKFSVVVIDIRAYRSRQDLRQQRDRLLEFIRNGGRVLCFYHKPREWNATDSRPLLAPFALEVGNARVCEEDAKVTLLDPSHRLWNVPNKITAADFDGWVQERGLNFPRKWAGNWQPMLEMSDTGAKPHRGALLLARHGKGSFVYCSLALYRQLRIGHAGAVRLLMNLLQG